MVRSQRLRIPIAAVVIGLAALAVSPASAQSGRPPQLVYDDEHTGEKFPKPVLPGFDELPIVRPLPDPFAWSDGSGRSTEFKDWARRRSEIKAEIEKYGIGEKPPRPKTKSSMRNRAFFLLLCVAATPCSAQTRIAVDSAQADAVIAPEI